MRVRIGLHEIVLHVSTIAIRGRTIHDLIETAQLRNAIGIPARTIEIPPLRTETGSQVIQTVAPAGYSIDRDPAASSVLTGTIAVIRITLPDATRTGIETQVVIKSSDVAGTLEVPVGWRILDRIETERTTSSHVLVRAAGTTMGSS